MFGSKAKKENIQLKQRIYELEQLMASIGAADVVQIDRRRRELEEQQAVLVEQAQQLQTEITSATQRLNITKSEEINVREEVTLQEFGLYDFKHPAEDSVQLQRELDIVRNQIKAAVKYKQATLQTENFTFNNSAAKGRSFVNKMSKMALRSYNAEVENAITRMKAGNLSAAIKRIERARDQVTKMGDMIDLSIAPSYHQLRIAELQLASKHLAAKAAAKEAEREERAQLREEKKAQAEMEAERKRLEKERTHYENSIAKLREQNRLEEIEELQAQLHEINRGIEDVDYRAANVRAGYVYVISNIGSFGERMVKIGLTRRLDPMERVKELGDASVPFNFDVHVLHFSKDAVTVEAELHRKFDDVKVNLINTRREFFYATPAEVKSALLEIDGSVLEYEERPEAEQFRQSTSLRKQQLNN